MHTIHHTDVAVIGGGVAGVSAAVAAAQQGLQVTLLEQLPFLGGKATAAQVGTICGLYRFSKVSGANFITRGFARNFGEELQQRSGTAPLSNAAGLHYLPYDTAVFKTLCTELLFENKVQVHLDTVLNTVELDGNHIGQLTANNYQGSFRLLPRVVIDCSGEAIISRLADLPILKSDHYQAAAQVFSLAGVADTTEGALGMILKKTLQSAIDDGLLAPHLDRVTIIQGSLKDKKLSLKAGIPVPVTHTPGNLAELKHSAIQLVQDLSRFLIGQVAVFKNAHLADIAPEIGIRVSERPLGKQVLTEEDVLNCKKEENAIANGAWPIEEWEQNKRVKMRYFSLDDFYQVPAGCLQSQPVANLFMAGRNISATTGAIASARVMGTCLQTGFAAGMMAAANVLNISEMEIIKNIQNLQL